METPEWREESDGTFVAETTRFSLIAHRTADRQHARFLIFARDVARDDELVGSGTRPSISEAMCAAETVVRRSRNAVQRTGALVIVVDRDDAMRGTVANSLRDDGYRVADVASGEEALRRFERIARPSILITDIDLGAGMDGLQLAAWVRQLWPTTGVLLMGCDVDLLAGASVRDAVLTKPFSTDRLVASVATIAARVSPSAGASLN